MRFLDFVASAPLYYLIVGGVIEVCLILLLKWPIQLLNLRGRAEMVSFICVQLSTLTITSLGTLRLAQIHSDSSMTFSVLAFLCFSLVVWVNLRAISVSNERRQQSLRGWNGDVFSQDNMRSRQVMRNEAEWTETFVIPLSFLAIGIILLVPSLYDNSFTQYSTELILRILEFKAVRWIVIPLGLIISAQSLLKFWQLAIWISKGGSKARRGA
jgi:hypothetical protein